MKRISICGILILVGVVLTSFAQDTSTVNVNASVPEVLELTYWIRWAEEGQDPYEFGFSGNDTAIDFGPLEWNEELGLWVAKRYYTVFLVARSSGRAYQIKQSSTGLVNGSLNLNESFLMDPDYQDADEFTPGNPQGPIPEGDSVGDSGLAASDERVVYDGNAGLSTIVRVYYGLSTGDDDIGKPITGDYPAGDYNGTVTFTLTLK